MMDERIKPGSVVQANERAQQEWCGTLLTVGEVKPWGVQAWAHIPMRGDAYIRLKWEQIDYIGEAVMMPADYEIEKAGEKA